MPYIESKKFALESWCQKKNLPRFTHYSFHLSFTFGEVAESVHRIGLLLSNHNMSLDLGVSQNWEHRGVIPLSAPKFLKRAHRCSLTNSRRSWRSLRWEKLTDERQRRADWEKLRDDVGLWLLQNVETFRSGRAQRWGSGVRRKMRERARERNPSTSAVGGLLL